VRITLPRIPASHSACWIRAPLFRHSTKLLARHRLVRPPPGVRRSLHPPQGAAALAESVEVVFLIGAVGCALSNFKISPQDFLASLSAPE
jgi:hypothetical protein